jgi:hypothetical protein
MADAIHGNTQVGPTKEEMIAQVVQRELIEGSVVASRVTDWSFLAEPGASQIEIPKGGSFTVANRAEGVAGDATVVAYTTDVMPLDFNAYLAWIVDYKSRVQSRIDVQLDLAARAARAHAFYLDQQIIAKLESAGQATTTAGVITYDIVLEMRETYRQRDGRLDQATLLVGTDTEAALLDIDEFKRAEVYGQAVIPSGVIGRVHGIDVVVSNKVAAESYYLFDRDAVGFGIQAGPSYSEQGANEFGSQAKRAVLDQLFGTWAGFLGQKGVGAGISALIIKDNNA